MCIRKGRKGKGQKKGKRKDAGGLVSLIVSLFHVPRTHALIYIKVPDSTSFVTINGKGNEGEKEIRYIKNAVVCRSLRPRSFRGLPPLLVGTDFWLCYSAE